MIFYCVKVSETKNSSSLFSIPHRAGSWVYRAKMFTHILSILQGRLEAVYAYFKT